MTSDIVPAWDIELPIKDELGAAFTEGEAAILALIAILCSVADLTERCVRY